mmetsp:Transcript_17538/g.48436  ORF Transcript_17538/g.48436 Transcript_17538/m.48436 type:complete len:211 (-) Transcript_17538:3046-3678(-)
MPVAMPIRPCKEASGTQQTLSMLTTTTTTTVPSTRIPLRGPSPPGRLLLYQPGGLFIGRTLAAARTAPTPGQGDCRREKVQAAPQNPHEAVRQAPGQTRSGRGGRPRLQRGQCQHGMEVPKLRTGRLLRKVLGISRVETQAHTGTRRRGKTKTTTAAAANQRTQFFSFKDDSPDQAVQQKQPQRAIEGTQRITKTQTDRGLDRFGIDPRT